MRGAKSVLKKPEVWKP